MSREVHIPLVLWISAAIVAHLAGGGGAVQVARVVEDKANMRALVHSVRDSFHPADKVFELLDESTLPTPSDQKVEAPKDDPNVDNTDKDPDGTPDPESAKEAAKQPPKPKEKEKEKEPPKVAEADKPKPPDPPKEQPKVVVPVPVMPAPPPPPPPEDHRIAIKQHADPNQADNPDANRIADEANHVKEETVAKIRSHDQDSAKPSLGGKPFKGGPGEGDSKDDKTADSEDHKGDVKHAPGENDNDSTSPKHNEPAPPQDAKVAAKASTPTVPGQTGGARAAQAPQVGGPPPREGGAGPASPDVIAGNDGNYTVDPANPGGDGKGRTAGRRRAAPPFQNPVKVDTIGFGKTGVPGGPQLNLQQPAFKAAVGDEQLAAERAADGAARRSRHRGSMEKNSFEKWKAAIENYEPSVKTGNQTALNAARSVFATYLNSIHNRIHPIFAEEFLASLDNVPANHPLNKGDLITHIEIVLNKDQGRIVRMGVTKASGVTAFDIVALNSVNRAQPFGKAPDAIVSPDGNVYLHWEFHRDPYDACTTRNARPYLLKAAPTLTPAAPPKPGKAPSPGTSDDPKSAPLLPLK